MRGISRVVLARQLHEAIVRDGRAACGGLGEWWSEQEAAHAAAASGQASAVAAAPAMRLCGECPEISRCAERAELDSYTGLAAGAAYCNGRAKPTRVVPRHSVQADVAKAG